MCKAFDDWEEEIREEAFKEADVKVKKAQEETRKLQMDLVQAVKSLKEFLPCEAIAEKLGMPMEMIVNL